MKTTVVPAQITTVEDKIAGNLSFTQLLLLTTPVFLGGAVFILIPPMFGYTVLKLVIATCLAFICIMLAIRIKGKILAQWIAVIARYRLRPQFYLFNKNDLFLRGRMKQSEQEVKTIPEEQILSETTDTLSRIPTHQMAQIESAITDPRAKFHLKAEKGGLRVYIHEIKEESI